ncbi:MAG: BON domain-containing protein [Bdellovibrionia bacterium]
MKFCLQRLFPLRSFFKNGKNSHPSPKTLLHPPLSACRKASGAFWSESLPRFGSGFHAFLLFSCLLLGGCSSLRPRLLQVHRTWGHPASHLQAMVGDTQTLSDEELQILAENTSLSISNLGTRRPRIRVKDGVITLSGALSSRKSRETLVHTLNQIPEAQGVVDQTVLPSSFTEHDSRILREAKLALALNSNLIGTDIDVFVHRGIVNLQGRVDSLAKKILAGKIIALGRGPLLIRNRIFVSYEASH